MAKHKSNPFANVFLNNEWTNTSYVTLMFSQNRQPITNKHSSPLVSERQNTSNCTCLLFLTYFCNKQHHDSVVIPPITLSHFKRSPVIFHFFLSRVCSEKYGGQTSPESVFTFNQPGLSKFRPITKRRLFV